MVKNQRTIGFKNHGDINVLELTFDEGRMDLIFSIRNFLNANRIDSREVELRIPMADNGGKQDLINGLEISRMVITRNMEATKLVIMAEYK